MADNLSEFQKLGASPITIPITSLLVPGQCLEDTLRKNKAQWHNSCRSRIGTTILNRKRKQHLRPPSPDNVSPVKTRKCSGATSTDEERGAYFFCDGPSGSVGMHSVQTMELDQRIKHHAHSLCDKSLLRKLAAAGDMVAAESKYHLACLISFERRIPKFAEPEADDHTVQSNVENLAFEEVVSFIEEFRDSEDSAPVFGMPQLCKMYRSCLERYGAKDIWVHSSRLRDRLLKAVPDLVCSHKGREYILLFQHDIGEAVMKACANDTASDVLQLCKAARIIRKDLHNMHAAFNGTFPENCQQTAVPSSLTTLVDFILNGPGKEENNTPKQSVLSLSQLIAFNYVKRSTKASTSLKMRGKETPLPIYLSLKVHAETRKRGLVDMLHDLGLGIGYDRLLTISADVASSVCHQFEETAVVVPTKMLKGVFTTAALDNIDHNPSSTTACDSLHGTSISLAQHRTSEENGEQQEILLISTEDDADKGQLHRDNPTHSGKKKIPHLPLKYTNVLPVEPPVREQFVPALPGPHKPVITEEVENFQNEQDWLQHVYTMLETEPMCVQKRMSWAAFHASQQLPRLDQTVANIGLLPLLLENSHSTALIKHCMDRIQEATEYLNKAQTPVVAADQPLFAILKAVQWWWPATYGEDKFVCMLGGLHIELAALKTLGDWLQGSGWVRLITEAGVATPGVADSLLKASHISRTRHSHQVCMNILPNL